ncbi:MAG: ATP-binding protein, partial [Acetobacteraceae bacterium]|nr:ATP-binding protein [Acetobacteraceae bacterium]
MAITLQFSSTPYPGLRPFRYDESDVFFGRERQVDQLLDRLAHNRFVAITGPSGCGKSSLVRAGMIPALQAGFMADVGSRWRICVLRPGARPLRRLADALASPEIFGADRANEGAAVRGEAALRRGPLGLIEIVKGTEALQGATLLVLVDQFEEIFRFRERIAADEADAFVALLLASAGQTEVPIYVVITMRSDYLGECAVFHGLAEAVSNSQYLTPRLTREELELAIAGPARVFGGQVEPKLLNRLLNDFGTAHDQLPLLQHALARLWSRCSGSSPAPVLTVKDYEAIGGLAEALSHHGDEILAELTPEQQRIAEIMFRRLSGSEDGRQDVRCPARVKEVAQIAGVDPSEVITVAEAFCGGDRCFLAAPEGLLRGDTMLDISHESLIRQWRRLAGWVADEAKSAEMYRRLSDWALRWEQGNAELWRGPDLASALKWREQEAPSAEWARRYGDVEQFQRAMKFLAASEEARRLAMVAEAKMRQRQVRRLRRAVLGLGLATTGLAAVILGYWVGFVREYDTYYTDFVNRWDAPQGIGAPLSASEIRNHSASYKIIRRGLLDGPVVR